MIIEMFQVLLALKHLNGHEEAKSLLQKTMPVARRVKAMGPA